MSINLDDPEVFKNVFNTVKFVIVDCDGVIWLGIKVIPGAPEAIKAMRKAGKRIIFCTNNNLRGRQELLNRLNKFGFEATMDEIMNTIHAVALYLQCDETIKKVYLMALDQMQEELEAHGIKCIGVGLEHQSSDLAELVRNVQLEDDVDAVVIGFDPTISYAKLIKGLTYAKRCKRIIAANCDLTLPCSRKELSVPDVGPMAAFLERASGVSPIFIGKPTKFFFNCIKIMVPEIDPNQTMIFGDTLMTDIAFGISNGLKYTCLVESGNNCMADVDLNNVNGFSNSNPTHYIKDISIINKFL